MTAYYNEIDPYAASWLRNLIKAGHIADGIVDERSIEDVVPAELAEFNQCHFFAGIGVWSLALRRAGWADDVPVWTGSCPCQPFSAAGKGAGFDDERHLWPHFHWLISQCQPAVVFGEQVASKDADPWIDLVQADLEALDYAFGAIPFPAAGVGAPHIRDRLYWMANAQIGGRREKRANAGGISAGNSTKGIATGSLPGGSVNGFWGDADWLVCRDGKFRPVEPGTFPLVDGNSFRVDSGSPFAGKSRAGMLKAAGNAINAEAAVVFIESAMECMP